MWTKLNTWFEKHKKSLQIGIILAFIGGLNTFGFAPFDIFIIPPLTLIALVYTLQNYTNGNSKKALFFGWCYGLGWFGAGISWVHVSLDTYGGMPLVGSLALMALLVSYLAIYPALACWLTQKYSPNRHYWPLSFALFWFIAEFLRSSIFTGFPWLSIGYSQMNSPLNVLAPVIGEIGITFIVCILAALPYQLKQWKVPVLTMTLLASIIALMPTQWTKPLDSSKQVMLVQGNIEQSLRWEPERDWPNMLKHLDLSRPHYSEVDLIVWPEAAIPILEPLAQVELETLNEALTNNKTALITGIINYQPEPRAIYNALITLGLRNPEDDSGQYYYQHNNRYYKHHLLPIGEFVPFEDILRPLAPIFDLPMSSFTRGEIRQPNLRANGINLASNICYEIIFPRQIRQNINNHSDMILTVSNDAWFGNSIGPHQHMQIAQMRALEFGRPVLRATNNGVTAVTDEKGNIIAKLEQFKAGVLKTEVKLVTGVTPYLKYGDKPLWTISALLLLILIVTRKLTLNQKPSKQSESS